MTELQQEYRRNGYAYRLIARTEHAAIYAQMDGKRVAAYEVGKVKTRPDGEIGGKAIEGGECFWGNEDFGVIAWCIIDRDRAMERLHEITAREQRKARENSAAQ